MSTSQRFDPALRPRPPHSAQGVSAILPSPAQASQTTARTIWPKAVRVTWRSCPAPSQRSQVRIGVPGSAPLPLQCSQTPTASKVISRCGPGQHLLEADLDRGGDVPAAGRAAAAEPEGVPGADRRRPGRCPRSSRTRAARRPATGTQAVVAEGVIGLAPLRVGEHLVGLRRLLELLLGGGVVRVDVRMELPGEAAEGPLHLRVGGPTLEPEHLVVVARHRPAQGS